MWIFVLVVSAIVTKASGETYYISNETADSSNAERQCKQDQLATPPIKFSKNGQEADLANSNIKVINESMWVGFVMAYSTFVFKGCAREDPLTTVNITDDIPADLGLCYSFCKTRYIGIKLKDPYQQNESTCYCITTRPDVLHDIQGTLCEHWNIVKGGSIENNYVSVYEKGNKPYTPSSEYVDGKCLAFDTYSRSFVWSGCSTSYRGMCQNGNSIWTPDGYAGWKTMTLKCLKEGGLPVDPCTNLSSVHGKDQVWTGAIRSWSIFTLSDEFEIDRNFRQGYIDTSSKLQFDSQTSSLRLRSLCTGSTLISSSSSTRRAAQPSSITTTTPFHSNARSSTQPTSSSNTMSSKSPATDNITLSLTPPVSNTHYTITPASNGNADKKSDDSKSGIVVLAVVVPLATLAIAAAIGFVIWRKRRKHQEKRSQTPEHSSFPPQNGLNQLKGTTVSQNGFTSKEAEATQRHDYLILEPMNEYAAIKDTDMEQYYDGDYDTTEGAIRRNISDSDNGNIYNRLDDVSEDTYNHTNTLNLRDDDTYNHTGDCGDETTYNTVESLSRPKKDSVVVHSDNRKANNVDDTYNHIHVA